MYTRYVYITVNQNFGRHKTTESESNGGWSACEPVAFTLQAIPPGQAFVRTLGLSNAELFPERQWREPRTRRWWGSGTLPKATLAVATRMTPALRRATMRTILMFH